MLEEKAIFIACTAKRRLMIKIICLEVIEGFSFLETNIKIAELISVSVKVRSQEMKFDRFIGEIRSNLKEEIIEIKMHIKKIIRLSIFEISIGFFWGTWLLLHR